MRYVSSIPPATSKTESSKVKGLANIYTVKPVHPNVQTESYPVSQAPRDGQAHVIEVPKNRSETLVEDRRKTCRRVNHQPVIIELRSGVDRRRHHLLDGDIVEHIDEKA